MKLILTSRDNLKDVPPEYRILKVKENTLEDLNDITNHSCEEIICEEVFENIAYEQFLEAAQTIFTKLRLNGTILFKGIDLNFIMEQHRINLIDEEYVNKLIYNNKSVTSVKSILSIARQFGLNMVSLDRQGFIYKLILSRIS
jgi:predicted SAM-dependent methyltransferase